MLCHEVNINYASKSKLVEKIWIQLQIWVKLSNQIQQSYTIIGKKINKTNSYTFLSKNFEHKFLMNLQNS